MDKDRKQRLVELGAEALANALLDLAEHNEVADDRVERMIATPKENIKRFKAKLSGLKRMRRLIRWGESAGFARELVAILEDLKAGIEDVRTGAELVAAFYEADKEFSISALEKALTLSSSEIFNSDQGSQFTSTEFTGVLEKLKIAISMDGRGRALDNIFVERLWRR